MCILSLAIFNVSCLQGLQLGTEKCGPFVLTFPTRPPSCPFPVPFYSLPFPWSRSLHPAGDGKRCMPRLKAHLCIFLLKMHLIAVSFCFFVKSLCTQRVRKWGTHHRMPLLQNWGSCPPSHASCPSLPVATSQCRRVKSCLTDRQTFNECSSTDSECSVCLSTSAHTHNVTL